MKTIIECPRESDVLDALAAQRWPHRADRELVDHVASCAVCSDVLSVAAAMRDDHDAVWREASVPSSGQVWWRAEMRARQEAIRQATRPMTVLYGLTSVVALAVIAAAAWFAWPIAHQYISTIDTTQAPLASPLALPMLVAVAALLVVAPLALYFVFSDE